MRNLAVVYQLSATLIVYQALIFQGEASAAPNLAFLSVCLGIFLIQFMHS